MESTITKLDVLRALAQSQYDTVASMDFVEAMQDVSPGYNHFRLIYEQPGELGTYLYPSDGDRNRRALYSEFSHMSDSLFRQMMETHTINVDEVSQEDRDNMWRDAWNRGHSNGYREVWSYYTEVVDMYDRVQRGQIQREEFDEYLDI